MQTNGTSNDLRELMIQADEGERPRRDVLDRLSDVVRRGRRDRNAINRIVHEYGIPNDAGIGETIVDRTMEHVGQVVAHYDSEHPFRS